jgi:ribonuclease HI
LNILLRCDETTDTSIYTDGSAFSNPSRGGFASVIVQGSHQQRISGGFLETTSMRMELTAAVVALEYLTERCKVRLVTDCRMLQRAVEEDISTVGKISGWNLFLTRAAPVIVERQIPLDVPCIWERSRICNSSNCITTTERVYSSRPCTSAGGLVASTAGKVSIIL